MSLLRESTDLVRGLLAAWDETNGETCDCRTEPENDGHVCEFCKARDFLSRAESALTRCQVVEWVPVSERLPEVAGWYQIITPGPVEHRFAWWYAKSGCWNTADQITHWLTPLKHPAQLAKEAAGES